MLGSPGAARVMLAATEGEFGELLWRLDDRTELEYDPTWRHHHWSLRTGNGGCSIRREVARLILAGLLGESRCRELRAWVEERHGLEAALVPDGEGSPVADVLSDVLDQMEGR